MMSMGSMRQHGNHGKHEEQYEVGPHGVDPEENGEHEAV
jgi:hypothetical protein